MMRDMLKQDTVLEAQDAVLAEQTAMLKEELHFAEELAAKSVSA